MKFASARVLLAATAVCVSSVSVAGTLSGPYSVDVETLCPASQAVDTSGSPSLTVTSPGEISHMTGTIDFFEDRFKSSFANTDGAALASSANGHETGKHFALTDTQNFGNFALDSSTATFTYDQQSPQIFQAVYAQVDKDGTIHRANLLAAPANRHSGCAVLMFMELQTATGR